MFQCRTFTKIPNFGHSARSKLTELTRVVNGFTIMVIWHHSSVSLYSPYPPSLSCAVPLRLPSVLLHSLDPLYHGFSHLLRPPDSGALEGLFTCLRATYPAQSNLLVSTASPDRTQLSVMYNSAQSLFSIGLYIIHRIFISNTPTTLSHTGTYLTRSSV